MRTLPSGCRARYDEMEKVAGELLDNFHNGNRNDTRDHLKEYETLPALGIFSAMMKQADRQTKEDLVRYFVEVA